ncbi:hypothetical protein F503_06272 [Ophiostoma piceae UAMH 11346]|uniref:Uncharacterized protein n=1 Tax=Ophiostoma piceae (strain UAMH 11346) TaxID=1262450 RepID=S3CEL3_OPHP1|nr:hypothetical protein F503_06272 [Ophiostoma piceae UAMH 11346]
MSAPFAGLAAGLSAGAPRTPEPGASFATTRNDAPPLSPPSPPRRMRLKRRAAPHLSAPTQNFLASVAAADVPIPSIEVPDYDEQFTGMLGLQQHQQLQQPQHLQAQNPHQSLFAIENMDTNFLSVKSRTFSPPKTPAPEVATSASASSPSRYPDWSIDSVFSSSAESSPDPECGSSSRPSTARSTQTSSSSLFSRFSQLSDDDHCLSPEEDAPSKFKFGPTSHLHELRRNSASGGTFASSSLAVADGDNASSNQRRRARKPALTKAMSAHLWATYILYLQDPKVTPFRVGKSCVPPHGVLLRVAREAKRSWKGAKAMARASSNSTSKASSGAAVPEEPLSYTASANVPAVTVSSADSADTAGAARDGAASTKSGSSTPTATDSTANGTYMEWPFTNAATRAHLRELCRQKAATPGSGARGLQYMSRSPTPFTQAAATAATRPRNMHVAPGVSNETSFNAPINASSNAPVNARSHAPSGLTAFPSSSFGTKDMAISLVLSTSETMQPHGPLAQLTRVGRDRAYSSFNATNSYNPQSSRSSHRSHRSLGSHLYHPSGPPPSIDASIAAAMNIVSSSAPNGEGFNPAPATEVSGESSFAERRRLGSPFTARSYGPSSSSSLAAVLGLPTTNTRQPHTVGPRRSLQSPVRISRTSTQKTRRTKHLSQDLRRRPGLGTDFFTEPSAFSSFGFPLGPNEDNPSNANTAHNDDPFSPRTERMPSLVSSSSAPQLSLVAAAASRVSETLMDDAETAFPELTQTAAPTMRSLGDLNMDSGPFGGSLLDATAQPPARLGSPFGLPETNTSFSFPNRLFQSTADLDMAPVSRPFATVQRIAQPKSTAGRTDLASRLAYLDQRLREINNRGGNTRRSDSPA